MKKIATIVCLLIVSCTPYIKGPTVSGRFFQFADSSIDPAITGQFEFPAEEVCKKFVKINAFAYPIIRCFDKSAAEGLPFLAQVDAPDYSVYIRSASLGGCETSVESFTDRGQCQVVKTCHNSQIP